MASAEEGTLPNTRGTMVQHLDLISPSTQSKTAHRSAKQALQNTIRYHKKIIVIAGAGISVSAGIPDFRSSDGIFQRIRDEYKLKSSGKELFDASVYNNDHSTTSFHKVICEMSRLSKEARPTIFHRMLARLAREGRLLRIYTQNIDGLESKLPLLVTEVPISHRAPWPRTIQLHGGLDRMVCQKCQHVSAFQAELFEGSTPPQCPECTRLNTLRTADGGKRSHGIGRLRPRIVLYNENNPDAEGIGAVISSDIRQKPDTLIVVGTTLKIDAVKRMMRDIAAVVREQKDGTVIWINRDLVPVRRDLEDIFTLTVRGDADSVSKIVELGRPNESIENAKLDKEEDLSTDTSTSSEEEDTETLNSLRSDTALLEHYHELEQPSQQFRLRRQMFKPAWH